jgi:hypothetical protein
MITNTDDRHVRLARGFDRAHRHRCSRVIHFHRFANRVLDSFERRDGYGGVPLYQSSSTSFDAWPITAIDFNDFLSSGKRLAEFFKQDDRLLRSEQCQRFVLVCEPRIDRLLADDE